MENRTSCTDDILLALTQSQKTICSRMLAYPDTSQALNQARGISVFLIYLGEPSYIQFWDRFVAVLIKASYMRSNTEEMKEVLSEYYVGNS